ncbi:hypothetical protein [Paenibacillus rhizoplanae]|uniref:Uncharacterized protein n=1 Tax=Paenibacillus rhizoplanae TaxID=1917181 RepID=A0ABW5EZQ9_9BACL
MNAEIKELATVDIKAAMRKEYIENELFLSKQFIKHTTPRYIKEITFYTMARNHVIHTFLSLTESEQTIQALRETKSPSQEYVELMNKHRAMRYPLAIKVKAEKSIYNDYTHVDYKRKAHFLDQALPTPSRRESVFNKLGGVLELLISWGWVAFWIIVILISIFSDSDDSSLTGLDKSSNNKDTFHSGGILNGNTNSKTVEDTPQIIDASNEAGYGNPGDSSHDAPSSKNSNAPTKQSSENSETSSKKSDTQSANQNVKTQTQKVQVGPIRNHLISASYFLPESNGNGIFEIYDGYTIELMENEKVVIDFEITSDIDPVFKLNGEVVESHPTTNEDVEWISFYQTKQVTKVEVNINEEIHNFYFVPME